MNKKFRFILLLILFSVSISLIRPDFIYADGVYPTGPTCSKLSTAKWEDTNLFDLTYGCIPAGWDAFFETKDVRAQVKNISDTIQHQVDQGYKIGPAIGNTFRALYLVKPSEIKAVIMGQDPAPQPGLATGLAFSTEPGVSSSKVASIQRVLLEVQNEGMCINLNDGDLRKWTQNGVLLLNMALSIPCPPEDSSCTIGGHVALWGLFTKYLVNYIDDNAGASSFILWGSRAGAYEKDVKNKLHNVIKGGHPSPRVPGVNFFCKNYFNCANQWLEANSREDINWNLISSCKSSQPCIWAWHSGSGTSTCSQSCTLQKCTATNILDVKTDQPFDVDIQSFTGKATFLDMLLKVKPEYIDKDYDRSFQIIGGDAYIAKLNSDFDPSVFKKIVNEFNGDQNKLEQAIDSIKGQTSTPGTVYNVILKAVTNVATDPKMAAELIAPTLSIASGAGTTIHFGSVIADEVGYASPNAKVKNPEKTGRGYASALPARKLLDASDVYYLKEINKILQAGDTNDPQSFFSAIMNVLTQCNAGNISSLNDQDREGVGDFLAVYFAEADRNAMSNLKQHSWQKDLLHASCLGSYVASAGGDTTKFWAKGKSGSGIGNTRTARHKLAMQVCNAEKKINSTVFNALQNLIGGEIKSYGGDLFQQLADYLNNPKNSAAILANADKISKAATDFMVAIHDDAQQIKDTGVPINI
ncbi:MAG: hypothetical protein CVU55_06330 [Deltaproteobacteria bacterium HGW-Deltaproteobacteria-13]|jgi:uracil-DNA glycosylase|nr:MAG: hypothetical protein CVU55_06330 [Deltaproteobacteria bacterium HGW-Deltaproteobacteria-13]